MSSTPAPSNNTKKGEHINGSRSTPLLLIHIFPWSSSVTEVPCCNYCHVCGAEISLLDPTSLMYKLHHYDNADENNLLELPRVYHCSHCKDKSVRYCSIGCRALGEKYALHFHHLTCRGSSLRGLDEFGRHIQAQIQSSKLASDFQLYFIWHCILAASLVILSNIQNDNYLDRLAGSNDIVSINNTSDNDEAVNHQLSSDVEFPKELNQFFLMALKATSQHKATAQSTAAIEEAWSLFSAALRNNFPTLSGLDSSVFFATYQLVQQCLHRISLPGTATEYLSKRLLSNVNDLGGILKVLKPYVGAAFEKDGTVQLQRASSQEDSCKTSTIIQHRQAARIAQIAGMNDVEDSTFRHLRHEFYALCFPANIFGWDSLPHSCAPNCAIEGVRDGDDDSKIAERTYYKSSACIISRGRIRIFLVALHDIKENESLSVSRISCIDQDLHLRAHELKLEFGTSFCCVCVRCRFERNPKTPALCFAEMKRIGDFAMQSGRFLDAISAYNAILSSMANVKSEADNTIGDVFHAKCAAYLGMGKFMVAQLLWRDASTICNSHEGIALQIRKQVAYNILDPIENDRTTSKRRKIVDSFERLPEFVTLLDGKCFVTKINQPVVSAAECQQAIEWAEHYAATKNGWTTSRHYSVPTTDLPIHDIPDLLVWFNQIMEKRLRPLLAQQFGSEKLGTNGCKLHVHDAFIVKYNSSEQRHLPLHRDESSHSFTLALSDDYEGGGTYVAVLGKAIKPSLGGLLSFRGDLLLHGGDVVIKGVRYIIAAFCYVADRHSKSVQGLSGTFRRNHDEVFSFGFNFQGCQE